MRGSAHEDVRQGRHGDQGLAVNFHEATASLGAERNDFEESKAEIQLRVGHLLLVRQLFGFALLFLLLLFFRGNEQRSVKISPLEVVEQIEQDLFDEDTAAERSVRRTERAQEGLSNLWTLVSRM